MPIKHNILLRADGNNEIGLGHVYRCMAIAERLKNHFNFYFAIQTPSVELKNSISEYSTCLALPQTANYIHEALQLCSMISNLRINIALLDGYFFNTDYQKIMKNCATKLICIDDDQLFKYIADVVINHAEGIDEKKIDANVETKKYIGFDYLLLRKKIIDLSKIQKKIGRIKKLFVCFGGADVSNITMKVARALKNNNDIDEVNVIIGLAYLYKDQLSKLLYNDAKFKIYENLDEDQMTQMFTICDMAIVPASTISLEAFSANMILLTGITADNQKNILHGLCKYSNVNCINDFNMVSEEEMRVEVSKIINTTKDITIQSPVSQSSDNLLNIFNSLL